MLFMATCWLLLQGLPTDGWRFMYIATISIHRHTLSYKSNNQVSCIDSSDVNTAVLSLLDVMCM